MEGGRRDVATPPGDLPGNIATHNRRQTYYFGEDGLLRRHDYEAEVIKGGPAAHYVSEYQEFDGIMVPTRRRVYPCNANGHPAREPLAVSIDLDQVSFT